METTTEPKTVPATALSAIPAEVIEGYLPPFPNEDTKPAVVVRCGEWFLRYSCGPKTGTFWDMYGDDFWTVELALSELAKADPVPAGKPYLTFRLPQRNDEEIRQEVEGPLYTPQGVAAWDGTPEDPISTEQMRAVAAQWRDTTQLANALDAAARRVEQLESELGRRGQ